MDASVIRRFAFSLWLLVAMGMTAAGPRWLSLPPTPTLPRAESSGYAPVNGIRIWYALFGRGSPVILLHGGLANSNYWGYQVPALQSIIGSSSWIAVDMGAAHVTAGPSATI